METGEYFSDLSALLEDTASISVELADDLLAVSSG